MVTTKAKSAGAAGTSTNKQKGEGGRSAPPNGDSGTPGRASPTNFNISKEASPAPVSSGSFKPDKDAYEAEQERLKTEIEALRAKLVRCFTHLILCPPSFTTPRPDGREGQDLAGRGFKLGKQ
jgi:hypothetical protein